MTSGWESDSRLAFKKDLLLSDAIPQPQQQHFANLNALHRQLEEMVVRTRRPGGNKREQRQEVQEPVLVIRGK
jgi:hypothetical protein